jgi:hypothetical protein
MKVKLLDQSHCTRCWRPLLTTTSWPGPRWSQLPPGCPRDRSLSVSSNCGHVFHASCIRESRHCRACLALIGDVKPLNVAFRSKNDDDDDDDDVKVS